MPRPERKRAAAAAPIELTPEQKAIELATKLAEFENLHDQRRIMIKAVGEEIVKKGLSGKALQTGSKLKTLVDSANTTEGDISIIPKNFQVKLNGIPGNERGIRLLFEPFVELFDKMNNAKVGLIALFQSSRAKSRDEMGGAIFPIGSQLSLLYEQNYANLLAAVNENYRGAFEEAYRAARKPVAEVGSRSTAATPTEPTTAADTTAPRTTATSERIPQGVDSTKAVSPTTASTIEEVEVEGGGFLGEGDDSSYDLDDLAGELGDAIAALDVEEGVEPVDTTATVDTAAARPVSPASTDGDDEGEDDPELSATAAAAASEDDGPQSRTPTPLPTTAAADTAATVDTAGPAAGAAAARPKAPTPPPPTVTDELDAAGPAAGAASLPGGAAATPPPTATELQRLGKGDAKVLHEALIEPKSSSTKRQSGLLGSKKVREIVDAINKKSNSPKFNTDWLGRTKEANTVDQTYSSLVKAYNAFDKLSQALNIYSESKDDVTTDGEVKGAYEELAKVLPAAFGLSDRKKLTSYDDLMAAGEFAQTIKSLQGLLRKRIKSVNTKSLGVTTSALFTPNDAEIKQLFTTKETNFEPAQPSPAFKTYGDIGEEYGDVTEPMVDSGAGDDPARSSAAATIPSSARNSASIATTPPKPKGPLLSASSPGLLTVASPPPREDGEAAVGGGDEDDNLYVEAIASVTDINNALANPDAHLAGAGADGGEAAAGEARTSGPLKAALDRFRRTHDAYGDELPPENKGLYFPATKIKVGDDEYDVKQEGQNIVITQGTKKITIDAQEENPQITEPLEGGVTVADLPNIMLAFLVHIEAVEITPIEIEQYVSLYGEGAMKDQYVSVYGRASDEPREESVLYGGAGGAAAEDPYYALPDASKALSPKDLAAMKAKGLNLEEFKAQRKAKIDGFVAKTASSGWGNAVTGLIRAERERIAADKAKAAGTVIHSTMSLGKASPSPSTGAKRRRWRWPRGFGNRVKKVGGKTRGEVGDTEDKLRAMSPEDKTLLKILMSQEDDGLLKITQEKYNTELGAQMTAGVRGVDMQVAIKQSLQNNKAVQDAFTEFAKQVHLSLHYLGFAFNKKQVRNKGSVLIDYVAKISYAGKDQMGQHLVDLWNHSFDIFYLQGGDLPPLTKREKFVVDDDPELYEIVTPRSRLLDSDVTPAQRGRAMTGLTRGLEQVAGGESPDPITLGSRSSSPELTGAAAADDDEEEIYAPATRGNQYHKDREGGGTTATAATSPGGDSTASGPYALAAANPISPTSPGGDSTASGAYASAASDRVTPASRRSSTDSGEYALAAANPISPAAPGDEEVLAGGTATPTEKPRTGKRVSFAPGLLSPGNGDARPDSASRPVSTASEEYASAVSTSSPTSPGDEGGPRASGAYALAAPGALQSIYDYAADKAPIKATEPTDQQIKDFEAAIEQSKTEKAPDIYRGVGAKCDAIELEDGTRTLKITEVYSPEDIARFGGTVTQEQLQGAHITSITIGDAKLSVNDLLKGAGAKIDPGGDHKPGLEQIVEAFREKQANIQFEILTAGDEKIAVTCSKPNSTSLYAKSQEGEVPTYQSLHKMIEVAQIDELAGGNDKKHYVDGLIEGALIKGGAGRSPSGSRSPSPSPSPTEMAAPLSPAAVAARKVSGLTHGGASSGPARKAALNPGDE